MFQAITALRFVPQRRRPAAPHHPPLGSLLRICARGSLWFRRYRCFDLSCHRGTATLADAGRIRCPAWPGASPPGASLINITAILGDRNHGPAGALLALGGLLTFPLFILVAIASAYDTYSHLSDVQAATKAAAAAAVGLMFGTGLKLGKAILKSPVSLLIALSSFVAIGVFRLPLVSSILVLCPVAVGLVYWSSRR